MISERVKADDDVDFCGAYLIAHAGRRWRVYGDGGYYSQISGGVTIKGKVLRDASNAPVSFSSQEKAREWIGAGCPITDRRGGEIVFND